MRAFWLHPSDLTRRSHDLITESYTQSAFTTLVPVRVRSHVCLTPPIPGDTSRGHVLVMRAGVSCPAGSRECVTHETVPVRLFRSLDVIIKGGEIKIMRR